MSINREWYKTVAESLSDEAESQYWQIVGQLDRMPDDDEMRIIADVSAATTVAALKASAATAAQTDKMRQEVDAMLAASATRHSELAEKLASLTERLEETYGKNISQRRFSMLMEDAMEAMMGRVNAFLGGLSDKRLKEINHELDLGKESLRTISKLSPNLRDNMVVVSRHLQGVTNNLQKAALQFQAAALAMPIRSPRERCWMIALEGFLLIVGGGLGFWLGRHTMPS